MTSSARAAELWQDARQELKDRGQLQFFALLADTSGLRFDGDHLVVAVPSSTIKDWLIHRLYAMMQAIVSNLAGRPLDLAFEISAGRYTPPAVGPTNASHNAETRGDHRYLVVIPHIVWVVARDPYDLALWFFVKMVAGDDGECYLSAEELARALNMSVGKVVNCRTYLIEQGLLCGTFERLWYLSIPDLWSANSRWRNAVGNSLRSRIASRLDFHVQRRASPGEGAARLPSPGEGWASPGEDAMLLPSPGEGEASCHEGQASPGEGWASPGEAKENQRRKTRKKNPQEKPDDVYAPRTPTTPGSELSTPPGAHRSSSSLPAVMTWDALIDRYGDYRVRRAQQVARAKRKDDSIRYVHGILRNWEAEGTHR